MNNSNYLASAQCMFYTKIEPGAAISVHVRGTGRICNTSTSHAIRGCFTGCPLKLFVPRRQLGAKSFAAMIDVSVEMVIHDDVQAAPLEPIGRFVVTLRTGKDLSGTTLPKHERPQPHPRPFPDTQPAEKVVPVPHLDPLKAALPAPDSRVNVSDVFWMTTVMAAACGLGAIPFFFIEKLSKGWAAMANAVACGVMIAASFDLLHEAEGYGTAPLIIGLVTGCIFIKFMQDWLEQYEDVKFQDLRGADAHKILLFVGIMAAHAVGEGSGVGALFLSLPVTTTRSDSPPQCFTPTAMPPIGMSFRMLVHPLPHTPLCSRANSAASIGEPPEREQSHSHYRRCASAS